MLGEILLACVVGAVQATWWPWKAQYDGRWYDCTTHDGGWYFYPPGYPNSPRVACTLYNSYSKPWPFTEYQVWDSYSLSYRTCKDSAYYSDNFGAQYCGEYDKWFPYKWYDSSASTWRDCWQWEGEGGSRKWYFASGTTRSDCSNYKNVNYPWGNGYWFFDVLDRSYYYCRGYEYNKQGGQYSCAQPPGGGYALTPGSPYTNGNTYQGPALGGGY